jgi:RNA recognition motif-containing protein
MSGADERHEDEQSKIWLGGLNPSATQEDVEGLMKKYGEVARADLKGTYAFLVR